LSDVVKQLNSDINELNEKNLDLEELNDNIAVKNQEKLVEYSEQQKEVSFGHKFLFF
jgi:hypothetical protein